MQTTQQDARTRPAAARRLAARVHQMYTHATGHAFQVGSTYTTIQAPARAARSLAPQSAQLGSGMPAHRYARMQPCPHYLGRATAHASRRRIAGLRRVICSLRHFVPTRTCIVHVLLTKLSRYISCAATHGEPGGFRPLTFVLIMRRPTWWPRQPTCSGLSRHMVRRLSHCQYTRLA